LGEIEKARCSWEINHFAVSKNSRGEDRTLKR